MNFIVVVAIVVVGITICMFIVGLLQKSKAPHHALSETEMRRKLSMINGKGKELSQRTDLTTEKNQAVVAQIINNNEVLKKAKSA